VALTADLPLARPLSINKGRWHLFLQTALALEALVQPVELWRILRWPAGSCRCGRRHGKTSRRQAVSRAARASVARDEAGTTLGYAAAVDWILHLVAARAVGVGGAAGAGSCVVGYLIGASRAHCSTTRQYDNQNRTEQNRTEQNRTEQNRTEQNRTEQNRTEQNRTDQNSTAQHDTAQQHD
jgi:hypothetical protein